MFGNWLNGVDRKTKARICIGVSAICWSIWDRRNNLVFNRTNKFIFCRLSIWRRIGSSYGRIYSLWISDNLWLLIMPESWWSHMISSPVLCGSILVVFEMRRRFMLSFFCWLIHVSTLYDPWTANFELLKLCNKTVVCIDWCRGWDFIPHFEKT